MSWSEVLPCSHTAKCILMQLDTQQTFDSDHNSNVYTNVSQPLGRGPVPGPAINYTGPREVFLEVVILVF
jgi:hypothetical protein